jgi:hypothetical protein
MPIAEIRLGAWSDIHSFAKSLWLYRGQRSASWNLVTAFERCCDREGVPGSDRRRLEAELLRDFQRTYHQYGLHVPARDAVLEWTALMQHHGAPTRLLDFSYSIYVAAYFALETADDDCAVWGLNGPWSLQESVACLVKAGGSGATTFQTTTQTTHETVAGEVIFCDPVTKCALPVTPFRLNERLRTQRGTFVVPADVTAGFMDNLRQLPNYENADSVVKLILPKALRTEALEQLYQMNISRPSLFPGLDGYAQSLGIFHPSFRPASWVAPLRRGG